MEARQMNRYVRVFITLAESFGTVGSMCRHRPDVEVDQSEE
jgi:hypothetical protein